MMHKVIVLVAGIMLAGIAWLVVIPKDGDGPYEAVYTPFDFADDAPSGSMSVAGIMREAGLGDDSIRDAGRVACGMPLAFGMGTWGSGALGVQKYLGWDDDTQRRIGNDPDAGGTFFGATARDYNHLAIAHFTAYALAHCDDLKGTR